MACLVSYFARFHVPMACSLFGERIIEKLIEYKLNGTDTNLVPGRPGLEPVMVCKTKARSPRSNQVSNELTQYYSQNN